jgi:hypothetical protein
METGGVGPIVPMMAADYRRPTEQRLLEAKTQHACAGGEVFWPGMLILTRWVSK